MLVVGLTGVIGSGKSKVASMFAELGAGIIDCDAIAHQLTKDDSPVLTRLIELFGSQILDSENNLDRKSLRQLVFNVPELRTQLEQLLHPLIYQRVVEQLRTSTVRVKYWIIVVPLLFKSPEYLKLIERSIVVDCDYSLLLKRLQSRSQLSPVEVDAILATQISREKQLKLADDVIENNRDEAYLYDQVERLHHYYISRYYNAE